MFFKIQVVGEAGWVLIAHSVDRWGDFQASEPFSSHFKAPSARLALLQVFLRPLFELVMCTIVDPFVWSNSDFYFKFLTSLINFHSSAIIFVRWMLVHEPRFRFSLEFLSPHMNSYTLYEFCFFSASFLHVCKSPGLLIQFLPPEAQNRLSRDFICLIEPPSIQADFLVVQALYMGWDSITTWVWEYFSCWLVTVRVLFVRIEIHGLPSLHFDVFHRAVGQPSDFSTLPSCDCEFWLIKSGIQLRYVTFDLVCVVISFIFWMFEIRHWFFLFACHVSIQIYVYYRHIELFYHISGLGSMFSLDWVPLYVAFLLLDFPTLDAHFASRIYHTPNRYNHFHNQCCMLLMEIGCWIKLAQKIKTRNSIKKGGAKWQQKTRPNDRSKAKQPVSSTQNAINTIKTNLYLIKCGWKRWRLNVDKKRRDWWDFIQRQFWWTNHTLVKNKVPNEMKSCNNAWYNILH